MNQQIQTALVNVSSFVELASIVKDAKEDVSFFGHRFIYIKGYEGTLSINAFAVSVMTLIRQKNIDFQNQDEREAFKVIVPQISKIYEQNDARWKNPITFTLLTIRDKWNFYIKTELTGFDARFYWEDEYCENECDFSRQQGRLPRWILSEVTREPIQSVVSNISSFTDLLPIVKKTKEDISFFGCRYIYIEDYDGTLPISALASRVMQLAKTTLNYSQEDSYQEIVPLIDALYLRNDEKEKEKNPFTRILCLIRDVWNHYIKNDTDVSRFQWEQHKNEIDQKNE